ncbi:hypothetical protein ACIREE_41850 [Streptomyces sp. NPDC102467]|uniref:hypothetical protein n=1 Tax=Streptomyces sp. NPDC102467 TaxID=3366179 RepID=UPI0037FC568C
MSSNAGQDGQQASARPESEVIVFLKEYQEPERRGPGPVSIGLSMLICLGFIAWAIGIALK